MPQDVKLELVDIKKIKIPPERGRQEFTKVVELAESIKRYGIISPIVVAIRADGNFDLVAGERRFRASLMAGLAHIPATLREDAPDHFLSEIELEENVCRENLTYEEEGLILAKIEKQKKAHDKTWTMSDTATMTGRSIGDVSGKIKIAKEFEDPEIKAACADGKMPYTAALKKIEQIREAQKLKRLSEQGSIKLETNLLHGSCLDLIKDLATDSVDLLLTDPPYGIKSIEMLRTSGSRRFMNYGGMSDEHNQDIDAVMKIFDALAPELARVLKPSSHFYIFFPAQFTGVLLDRLEPAGFIFQPPLLIWDRGKITTPAMGYNYTSRVETILFGHLDPRGKRLNDSMSNVLEFSDVPKNERCYATEKPVPLLQTLIKQSTKLNDHVLDPFAGSASTLEAARKSGRQVTGFEINEHAFLNAQNRLKRDA